MQSVGSWHRVQGATQSSCSLPLVRERAVLEGKRDTETYADRCYESGACGLLVTCFSALLLVSMYSTACPSIITFPRKKKPAQSGALSVV